MGVKETPISRELDEELTAKDFENTQSPVKEQYFVPQHDVQFTDDLGELNMSTSSTGSKKLVRALDNLEIASSETVRVVNTPGQRMYNIGDFNFDSRTNVHLNHMLDKYYMNNEYAGAAANEEPTNGLVKRDMQNYHHDILDKAMSYTQGNQYSNLNESGEPRRNAIQLHYELPSFEGRESCDNTTNKIYPNLANPKYGLVDAYSGGKIMELVPFNKQFYPTIEELRSYFLFPEGLQDEQYGAYALKLGKGHLTYRNLADIAVIKEGYKFMGGFKSSENIYSCLYDGGHSDDIKQHSFNEVLLPSNSVAGFPLALTVYDAHKHFQLFLKSHPEDFEGKRIYEVCAEVDCNIEYEPLAEIGDGYLFEPNENLIRFSDIICRVNNYPIKRRDYFDVLLLCELFAKNLYDDFDEVCKLQVPSAYINCKFAFEHK